MSLNDAQQIFAFFFAIYFFMIVDRAHYTYKSWDTYSAWSGRSHHRNRLFAAWVLLVILPVTHFAILFTLLGLFNVTFTSTVTGVLRIVLISVSSFFSFGYFNLYGALIHHYPLSFFSDEERRNRMVEIRPYFWSHFFPGILYICFSTLFLLIALYL